MLEQRACDHSQLTLAMRHWWAFDMKTDLTGQAHVVFAWSIACKQAIHQANLHSHLQVLHDRSRQKSISILGQIVFRWIHQELITLISQWRSFTEAAAQAAALQHLAKLANLPKLAKKLAVTDQIREIAADLVVGGVARTRAQSVLLLRRLTGQFSERILRSSLARWHSARKVAVRQAVCELRAACRLHSAGSLMLLKSSSRILRDTQAECVLHCVGTWRQGVHEADTTALIDTMSKLTSLVTIKEGEQAQSQSVLMLRRAAGSILHRSLRVALLSWSVAWKKATHETLLKQLRDMIRQRELISNESVSEARIRAVGILLQVKSRATQRRLGMCVSAWYFERKMSLQQDTQKQLDLAAVARTVVQGMTILRMVVGRVCRVELRGYILQWCTGWQELEQRAQLRQMATDIVSNAHHKGLLQLSATVARLSIAAVLQHIQLWHIMWKEAVQAAVLENILVSQAISRLMLLKSQAMSLLMHTSHRAMRAQMMTHVHQWRNSRESTFKRGQILLCVRLNLRVTSTLSACRQAIRGWMHHVVEEDLRVANLRLIEEQALVASLQDAYEILECEARDHALDQANLLEQRCESQSQCIAQVVQTACKELDQLDGILANGHIVKSKWVASERLWSTRVQTALHSIDAMEQRAAQTTDLLTEALAHARLPTRSLFELVADEEEMSSYEIVSNTTVSTHACTQHTSIGKTSTQIKLSSEQKASASALASVLWPTGAM